MAWSKQGTSNAMSVHSQVFYTLWASWNQAADPMLSFDARSKPSTVSDWFLFKMAKQSGWIWIWDWDLSLWGSHTAEEDKSVQPMASHLCFQAMLKGLSAVPLRCPVALFACVLAAEYIPRSPNRLVQRKETSQSTIPWFASSKSKED